ncbi:MAG: hypothetical protein CMJ89_03310 [Planctomycetes bacterium]|nr:hypothetical protein [Planctomycetota bacterium]
MSEVTYEKLVDEKRFVRLLQAHAEVFLSLTKLLSAQAGATWNKRHYYQLINETDTLESVLDDYGARYNRTYAFFTELVASIRWFAHTGYSIVHLLGRLESYRGDEADQADWLEAHGEIEKGLQFVQSYTIDLIDGVRGEAVGLGLKPSKRSFPEEDFLPVMARKRLPRNVGQTDLVQEQHRIAEVATKYLQAREMLRETGVRRIDDHEERHRRFARVCSEEHARVYEATIHNLQSTYDTHIQNTVVEAKDSRLSRLRGYISPALHLLQAVTFLAHFIERHETVIRSEDAKSKIAELIDSSEVEGVAWNLFLFWADRFLDSGVPLAQELLPEYTNLIELEVDLPSELSLHARPAALVVGIVNHYGTPVEMEVGGKRCNAGSILELLVTVGSLPGHKNFTFRGDERPLQAIGLLFQHSLGEHGLENLPEELGYLRH